MLTLSDCEVLSFDVHLCRAGKVASLYIPAMLPRDAWCGVYPVNVEFLLHSREELYTLHTVIISDLHPLISEAVQLYDALPGSIAATQLLTEPPKSACIWYEDAADAQAAVDKVCSFEYFTLSG